MDNPDLVLQETGSRLTYSRLNYVLSGDTLRRDAISSLRLVLGLAKGSTLRLVGSGLKFCEEDLNMAAINFSPLQNLKWL